MVSRTLLIANVACAITLTSVLSASLITPCKSSDEECAKQNAIKLAPLFVDGIPEYGVEKLDPLFFKTVDSSSPNLKFILSDLTLKGLKTCKPLKAQHGKGKSKFVIKLSCAMQLDGNYEMNGQVLVLKIAGKGKVHVFLRNVIIEVILDYVLKEGKDGIKHIRIKKFNHTYELKEKSDVVFEGLFQDNDVLSQAADDLIKNNGNEIVQEIGGKMFTAALTKVVENFNNFFEKLPYDEVSLD